MAYCTSVDVERLLPDAVVIEGTNVTPDLIDPRPESLSVVEIDWYIDQADSYVNSILSAIYDIPLRKSNIGGVVRYPDPIPFISSALSTYYVMTQRLSAGDHAASAESIIKLRDRALELLDKIFNGEIRLVNQNSYTSHRTIKSDLFAIPPGTSSNPANFKQ